MRAVLLYIVPFILIKKKPQTLGLSFQLAERPLSACQTRSPAVTAAPMQQQKGAGEGQPWQGSACWGRLHGIVWLMLGNSLCSSW